MDELIRSVPFELIRADSGDGLTLEGYAAVFDSPTEINSWEGNFIEVIQRGAFKKTLRERTPILMYDHGQHPLIGQMPLGSIKQAREDERGLYIQARLTDNWLVQPVRDAIREGAVDGMSFRFQAIRDSWDPPQGSALKKGQLRTRTLLEVRMSELGPVNFPAYTATTVGVRSEDQLRELITRLMQHSTSSDAARTGTSEDAADDETPAIEATSRIPRSERRKRALEIREWIR